MKRKTLLLLPLLMSSALSAQEVISASGNEFVQPEGSITYTLGEPIILTTVGPEHIMTQGFNQPWAVIITEVSELETSGILLYPNPTRHVLHVDLGRIPSGHRYELIDSKGALVMNGRVVDQLTTLDMEQFSSGGYVFRLYDPKENRPYSYKINVTR